MKRGDTMEVKETKDKDIKISESLRLKLKYYAQQKVFGLMMS